MKPCPDRQDTLWLDVYGELAAEERSVWDRHVDVCAGCREERDRLLQMLAMIRESTPRPELSSAQAEALRSSLMKRLTQRRAKLSRRRTLFGLSLQPIPALAAASVLLVALGWLGLRGIQAPPALRSIFGLNGEEQTIAKDIKG